LLTAVRDDTLKVLEEARNGKMIGNALEAKVKLYAKGDLHALLEENKTVLPMLFIVSQVEVSEGEGPADAAGAATVSDLWISVAQADGAKCGRCWNYSAGVGQDAEHPSLCPRCAAVVREWPA